MSSSRLKNGNPIRRGRFRSLAAALAGVLLAGGLTAVAAPQAALAAPNLACLNTVYLANNTANDIRQLSLPSGTLSPTPVFANPGTAGTNVNQLGIAANGTTTFHGTTTSLVQHNLGPETNAVIAKPTGIGAGTVGSVNPLTGLYYYGAYSGATLNLYVYTPGATTAPAGPVAAVTVTNPPGGNGDIAFDKAGRLYIVAGGATEAALYVMSGVLPTSGTGATFTATEISRGATTAATNGIAFASDGLLYLGSTTRIQQTNPITGQPTGTAFTLTGVNSTDLGTCATPSTTEVVSSFPSGKDQPSDQVSIVVGGGSYGTPGTAPDFPSSSPNPDGSASTAPGLVLPGESYTVVQNPVGSTNLGAYNTTWSCVTQTGSVVSSGTGNTATFTAPTGTDGSTIVCSFVNQLPPPVAVDDSGQGAYGQPVTVPGSTNDTPGNGAIVPGSTVFTSPSATDGGKTLVTPQGTWTIAPSGQITFTPAAGYSGTTSTEYRVVDDNGLSDTGTATVTVRPGPTAGADPVGTSQGQAITIPVLGNDTPGQNPDGTPGTIPPASVLFQPTGQPAGAVLSGDRRTLQVPGQGTYVINPATGAVTFTPVSTFNGVASPVAYGFTDSQGNSAAGTITVTVTAVGPAANDDTAQTIFNAPVTVDVRANDTAGPGGAIDTSLTVLTSPSATDGGKTLVTPQGTWTVGTDGQITFTPAAGYSGTTSTQYQVTDANGQTDTATVTVTVRPGPVAINDTASTAQNVPVTFPILGNDTPGVAANGTPGTFDPASVAFTLTPGLPAGSTVSPNGRTLTVPGEGVYTFDPATSQVTFTPEAQFSGPASPVTYVVTDSTGNQASATVGVSVTPIRPVAIDDAAKTPGDVPVTVDLVGNDLAGAASAPLDPASVVFTSPDATSGGKVLTVPGEGTFTIAPDGTVTFEPVDGFSGVVGPVQYSVTDANGTTDTADVAITVGNGLLATPDGATTLQGVPVDIPVLTNDVASDLGAPCDPGTPGEPAGCDTGDLDEGSVLFPTTGQPAGAEVTNGGRTLTVPDQGVYTIAPATGVITFTPVAGFTGPASEITYQVSDSLGASASTTVLVNVVAVIPTAANDSANTPYAVPVTIDLLDNDAPGDASAPLQPAQTRFAATGQPAGVTVSPDGLTAEIAGQGTYVLAADGTTEFTPANGFSGTTTPVIYVIEDENGTPTQASVQVTVRPGPTAVADTDTTLQGIAVTVSPLENDVPSRNADDSEGTWDAASLVFPVDGQPAGAVVSLDGKTLTVPDEGAYVIAADGSVEFTPVPAFTGTASPVVYAATDAIDNTASSTITITVTAVTPTAGDDEDVTTYLTPVTFDIVGNDDEGDPLVPLDPASTVFEAGYLPPGVAAEIRDAGKTLEVFGEGVWTLDPVDGSVTFAPADGFSGETTPVTYTIRDANGTPATAELTVTVLAGPDAVDDTDTTSQGIPVTLDPLANDVPSRTIDDEDGEWDAASVVFTADGQPAGAVVSLDGKTLTVPDEGEYEIAANGEVTFTPVPAFSGAASPVTYAATDSIGNTATATITITVGAVTPVASDDTAATPYGTPVTFDFFGNDEPGEDDVPLVVSSAVFEEANLPAGVTAEIRDAGKTLEISGVGVFTLNDDGTVTFTPADGFSGTVPPVTYTIADENGTTATAELIVIVRPGPSAVADTDRTAQAVPVTVDVLANDSAGLLADGTDAELDPASVVFTEDGQPSGAVLSADGKTLTVPGQGVYTIAADGSITFTPEATFRGEATPVTYAVTDSLGNSASTTLTVTVAGVDPTARDDSATTPHATPVTLDVLGNDSPGTSGAALDPASLQLVGAGGALVDQLVVPGEGVWTVVDGKLVFVPEDGFSGTTTPVTYSVADANGTRVTATATVTVAPADGTLPWTGTELSWIPLVAGIGLLLAGLVLAIRRRRTAVE